MVVLNKSKFERYIKEGVVDHRLTLLQKFGSVAKPVTDISISTSVEVNNKELITHPRLLLRKDSYKQASLENWHNVTKKVTEKKPKSVGLLKQSTLDKYKRKEPTINYYNYYG